MRRDRNVEGPAHRLDATDVIRMVVGEHDLGHPPAEPLAGRDERLRQPSVFSVVRRAGIDQHRVGDSQPGSRWCASPAARSGVATGNTRMPGRNSMMRNEPRLASSGSSNRGKSGLGAGIRQDAEQVEHRRRGERPAPLPELERPRGSDPFAELEFSRVRRAAGSSVRRATRAGRSDCRNGSGPSGGVNQRPANTSSRGVGNSQTGFLRELAQRSSDDSRGEIGADDFAFRLRGHRVGVERSAACRAPSVSASERSTAPPGKAYQPAMNASRCERRTQKTSSSAPTAPPEHDRRGRPRRLRRLGPGTTASDTPKYLLVEAHSFVPSVAPVAAADDKHRR